MVELKDGVILLRPFTLTNAREHLSKEDEAQVKWLSGGKSTLEGVQNWIKKNQTYWENNEPIFNFAIFDNANKLIGMIEANSDYKTVEGIEEGDANISYGLYPSARGKGYVTRAVNLLNDFLKSKDIKRGIIRIDPENADSLKVPQRCEFVEDRTITIKNGEKLIIFIKNLK
jgi:RimJ/RimL family protein N-acetyltransferase